MPSPGVLPVLGSSPCAFGSTPHAGRETQRRALGRGAALASRSAGFCQAAPARREDGHVVAGPPWWERTNKKPLWSPTHASPCHGNKFILRPAQGSAAAWRCDQEPVQPAASPEEEAEGMRTDFKLRKCRLQNLGCCFASLEGWELLSSLWAILSAL